MVLKTRDGAPIAGASRTKILKTAPHMKDIEATRVFTFFVKKNGIQEEICDIDDVLVQNQEGKQPGN